MSKPRVLTNCVANRYTGPDERVVEFSDRDLNLGGLISLRRRDDGKLIVQLYRLDDDVMVTVEAGHEWAPVADPEACSQCEGLGYLLGQTYGFAAVPDEWTEVQRCDTCCRFDGDQDAAAAAATALGLDPATDVRFFPPPADNKGDDEPGDYAVRCPQPAPVAR